MSDNKTAEKSEDLAEMPQSELRFLDAEAIEQDDPQPAVTRRPKHQNSSPGRSPLFRR